MSPCHSILILKKKIVIMEEPYMYFNLLLIPCIVNRCKLCNGMSLVELAVSFAHNLFTILFKFISTTANC